MSKESLIESPVNHMQPEFFNTPVNVHIDPFPSRQRSWYCLAYHYISQAGFHTTEILFLISH